jgi:CheY-like chemotaxis protein
MAAFRPRILVVDDSPDDVLILEHALERAGVEGPIHVCRDGLEAIDYLKGKGPYEDREAFPFPQMMISDVKMPRCSGLELLKWLRTHPKCSVVPVIMLSTSAMEADVEQAYQLGAHTYFQKPSHLATLVKLLKEVVGYWSHAALPELRQHCE